MKHSCQQAIDNTNLITLANNENQLTTQNIVLSKIRAVLMTFYESTNFGCENAIGLRLDFGKT